MVEVANCLSSLHAVRPMQYKIFLLIAFRIDLPNTDSDVDQGDVLVGQTSDQSSEVSAEDEIEEIMEIQKKAKKEFKRNFRTYKESKKKVKEIKKSRMGMLHTIQ